MTRQQAAQLLGASVSTIRRYEQQGRLQAFQNNGGATCYARVEVQRLQQQRAGVQDEGQRTAEAFELLEQGVSPVELVQRLRLTAEQAERYHQQWGRLKGKGVWVSEDAWHQMVRGLLAIPEEVAQDFNAGVRATTQLPQSEQALVRAVARAHDWSARGLLRTKAPPGSKGEEGLGELEVQLMRWLTPRLVEGCMVCLYDAADLQRKELLDSWPYNKDSNIAELVQDLVGEALEQRQGALDDVKTWKAERPRPPEKPRVPEDYAVCLVQQGQPVQRRRLRLPKQPKLP